VPFFETGARKQRNATLERAAIEKIRQMLDPLTGQDVYELFLEYEAVETIEAKFAKALDNLEVQFRHNVADLSTWEEVEYRLVFTKMDRHCSRDRFLREPCAMMKREAEEKMRVGGVDVSSSSAQHHPLTRGYLAGVPQRPRQRELIRHALPAASLPFTSQVIDRISGSRPACSPPETPDHTGGAQ
jgi:hypothetical protein